MSWRQFREHFRPTLALKLGLRVLASTSLIFSLAFAYNHHVARDLILKAAKENARHLVRSTVSQIEAVLHSVQPLPQLLALHLASRPHTLEEVRTLLQDEILAGPHVYGSGVAFAADAAAANAASVAPYYYRKDGQLHFADLGQASYDYASQDWYLLPRELGQPVWTDPYFDEGGGDTMMCTYAVPFYRAVDGERRFAGVVGADLELKQLVAVVSSVRLYKSGFAFLLSQTGQFISHPNSKFLLKESIFSRAEEINDPQWREIGRKMLRGEEGFVRGHWPDRTRFSWLHYGPISSGWSLGVVLPEEEVLADLHAMNSVVASIGVAGFALLVGVVALVSTGVARPIRALARQTHEIARGNLEFPLTHIESRDEVGVLSESFENMRVALKEYVANLAATTAAKERIESELKIARTIQRSFLPKRFPPFPDRTEFDIYAELEPARAVGGDLYDFFLLTPNEVFFLIGDVSGKGVPAALFMAVTKTLMKGVAEQNLSPAAVLEKVNTELHLDNEQMMFTTLFCGRLDLGTGKLSYSNAGHLPPLLLRPGCSPAWLELPQGSVLGVNASATYATRELELQPMDTLLLYTDGVTEAMNSALELFGEERLRSFSTHQSTVAPKPLVEDLFAAVRQFAGGEEQSDDITVLAIQFRHAPPDKPPSLAGTSPSSP